MVVGGCGWLSECMIGRKADIVIECEEIKERKLETEKESDRERTWGLFCTAAKDIIKSSALIN